MVRDQSYCSKEKAANKSVLSSDKEDDEEWLEGLSQDVAIPESPFIDAKNLCIELSRGIHNLQDKMINGRNDLHVFALFSHCLYHFWYSRGLKGHICASWKFDFWKAEIKSPNGSTDATALPSSLSAINHWFLKRRHVARIFPFKTLVNTYFIVAGKRTVFTWHAYANRFSYPIWHDQGLAQSNHYRPHIHLVSATVSWVYTISPYTFLFSRLAFQRKLIPFTHSFTFSQLQGCRHKTEE